MEGRLFPIISPRTLNRSTMTSMSKDWSVWLSSCTARAVVPASQMKLDITFSRMVPCLSRTCLPPTPVLIQHIKRALLQASFYWNQATTVQQDIPEFNAWGWYRDSTSKTWEPYWTNLGDTSVPLHCARKHVEGTASAVKPELVALLYVHVRMLVQTMMVETISDPVIVGDNVNSCERP